MTHHNPTALYGDAQAYRSIFADADTTKEHAFYRTLTGGAARVLDLGCGPSALARNVATQFGVGLDVEPALLRHAHDKLQLPAVRADIAATHGLPFATGAFNAVISHLFGVAYAAGALWEPPDIDLRADAIFSEICRVLAPGGRIALDIPLAYQPAQFVGQCETMPLANDKLYAFHYLGVLRTTRNFTILDTMIRIEEADRIMHELSAPLAVFTPDGALRLCKQAGFTNATFFAMNDTNATTKTPPAHTRRAVLKAVRN